MISSEVRRVRSHESNRVPKWATARGPGRHENLGPRHLWRSACRLMIEPSGACHSNGPCMAAFGLIDTLGSPELLHRSGRGLPGDADWGFSVSRGSALFDAT